MAKSESTPFGVDFSKYFTGQALDFGFPGLNIEAISDVQKKNFEAFGEASKLAAEAVENLFKRQGEMLKASADEFDTAVKAADGNGVPEFNPEKQAELAKAGFESAMANSRELMDLASTSGKKVIDVIGKRAADSVADLKAMQPVAKA